MGQKAGGKMKMERKEILMRGFALALAIFLWFYVGIEQNPLVERYYTVPVSLENVPVGLSATPEQQNVGVMIRERQDRLNSVQTENIKATIDLTDAKLGKNTYPVHVKTPGLLRVTRTQPKEMTVTVVQETGVNVPLQVNRTGELSEGLIVGDIQLSTYMVFVSGSQDLLQRVDYAAVTVNLDNISETYVSSLPVELFAADGTGLPTSGLTMNPPNVLVTVPVNANVTEKTVPVTAVTVGNPAAGYYLAEVTLSPQTVTIIGEPEALAEITEIETEAIDISGGDRDRRQSVELKLPEKVSVRGSTVVDMTIQFLKDEGEHTRYTVIPVTITGADATHKGEIRGDNQIRVYYVEDVDAQAAANQLRAVIDISNLQPGIHELNVSINNNNNALTVENIEPTMMTVVVT